MAQMNSAEAIRCCRCYLVVTLQGPGTTPVVVDSRSELVDVARLIKEHGRQAIPAMRHNTLKVPTLPRFPLLEGIFVNYLDQEHPKLRRPVAAINERQS